MAKEKKEELKKRLEELREEISRLDEHCLLLMADGENPEADRIFAGQRQNGIQRRRDRLVKEVAKIKKALNLPIHCPEREAAKIAELLKLNRVLALGLDPQEIDDTFKAIFRHSRQVQEMVT